MTPPDGVEIVPRLWIGSNKTCDAIRRDYRFVCINCGAKAHTNDQRCKFVPVCNSPDGLVNYDQIAKVERLVAAAWPQPTLNVLIHCGDALTYSPLVMALYLSARYQMPLRQAYQWVAASQPQLQDLSHLAAPVAKNTAWAGSV